MYVCMYMYNNIKKNLRRNLLRLRLLCNTNFSYTLDGYYN